MDWAWDAGRRHQGCLPRGRGPCDDGTGGRSGWPEETRVAGTLASAVVLEAESEERPHTAGHVRRTPRPTPGPEMRVFPGRSLFSLQALQTLERPS